MESIALKSTKARSKSLASAYLTLGSIPETTITEWKDIFETGDVRYEKLKYHALLRGLAKNAMRSLFWKIFLNYIPCEPSYWTDVLTPKRKAYEKFTDSIDSVPESGDPLSGMLGTPSSGEQKGQWEEYFQDQELKNTIRLDVERTHPDIEFFDSERTRSWMRNVLFVYSKHNSKFGYRQGMNEILAPLMMINAACSEPSQKNFPEDHPIRTVMHQDYIEHDTYWMFVEIMKSMSQYFFHEGKSEHPVVKKCKYIQHNLLRKLDPKLSNYLREAQVEPQLYGLRWFRLFFAREFHIRDVCSLWDAIFAMYQENQNFSLVDYISCAMLIYIRSDIINREYNYVLRRVMKFPPVEDVWVLVQSAIGLRDQSEKKKKIYPPKLKPIQKQNLLNSAGSGRKVNSEPEKSTKKKGNFIDKALQKVDDIKRFATGKSSRKRENETYKKAYERIVKLNEMISPKCEDIIEQMSQMQQKATKPKEEFAVIMAEMKLLYAMINGDIDI